MSSNSLQHMIFRNDKIKDTQIPQTTLLTTPGANGEKWGEGEEKVRSLCDELVLLEVGKVGR